MRLCTYSIMTRMEKRKGAFKTEERAANRRLRITLDFNLRAEFIAQL